MKLALLLFLLLPVMGFSSFLVDAKEIIGWAEKAVIYPGALEMRVKIDTGAKTSSLNCERTSYFEKDGENWIKCSVANYQGDILWLERRVERMVKIRRHHGEMQERPVIRMGVCLGNVYQVTEVNVIDRSGLDYPMLIGRQFLEQQFLVDPGTRYINPPHCDFSSRQ